MIISWANISPTFLFLLSILSIEKFQILLASSKPEKKTAIAEKLSGLQKLNEDQAFHQEEIDKIESKKRKVGEMLAKDIIKELQKAQKLQKKRNA